MIRIVATRVALAVLTLWAVSAVVFFGTQLLPGNPAEAALGPHAMPSQVKVLEQQFGLNRPVLDRYGSWLEGALHGDLGRSIPTGTPVSSVIADKLRNTAALTIATVLLLVPLSFLLGVASAVRKDRLFDHVVAVPSLVAIALPEFVVGTLLVVVVAVGFHLLPPVSLLDAQQSIFSQLNLLVLPVLTLVAAILAQIVRMVRAVTIDVLESEYVAMARLKGVPELRVLVRHVLPNAVGPTIQTIALNVAWLASGVVVTESVFQLPGVGLTLANAVSDRDIPTVEAIAMLVTVAYLAINLAADIAVVLLNPRLRART